MLVYWTVILLACAVIFPTSTLDAAAIWIIALLVLAFTFGAVLVTVKGHHHVVPARQPVKLDSGVIRFVVLLGSAGNIAALFITLHNSGRSISDVLSLAGLLDTGNAISVARYAGSAGDSLTPALAGLGYLAAAVAPFLIVTNAKRKVVYIALPIVTGVLYASVTTARLGFLICFALTVGGLIAASTLRNGEVPRVRFRSLILGVVSVGLIATAFIGIAQVRVGNLSNEAVAATMNKQIVYELGGPPAFSTWYNWYSATSDQPLTWGAANIAGIEYLTGQDRAATRAYDEFVVIDDIGHTSNVYTAFRGLLLDFGTAGGVVVMFLLGGLFGLAYRKTVNGSTAAASWMGYGYAMIALSSWLAITTFTNVLVVAFAAPLILYWARMRGRKSTSDGSDADVIPVNGPARGAPDSHSQV